MIKRYIALALSIILIVSALLLVACSNKWDQTDPDMPDEYKETQEELLEEHLDILKDEPENITSLQEVAFRYQMLGDYKSAAEYYEKCLDLSPQHIVCLNNIADVYEEVEEYELAAQYIMILFENQPAKEEVLNDTVRILLSAGDSLNATQALNHYEEQMITGEDAEDDARRYEFVIDPLREDIASWEEENIVGE